GPRRPAPPTASSRPVGAKGNNDGESGSVRGSRGERPLQDGPARFEEPTHDREKCRPRWPGRGGPSGPSRQRIGPMPVATIDWKGELPGRPVLIDQTLLPTKLEYLELATAEQMWEAIKVLRVRGAPAIGIAAAYGLVLGVQEFRGDDGAQFAAEVARVDQYLRTARPTAVNLFWALDRMRRRHADEAKRSVAEQKRALL